MSGSAEVRTTKPMPAVFIGHGSPMNALETNRYTSAWRTFGETVPTPRAILVVSAHWYVKEGGDRDAAANDPRLLRFPKRLFEVDYPAPGSPDLAGEVVEISSRSTVGLDQDSWGIDHGTWSVLVHAFPKADIPVVQLSINSLRDFDSHLDLGARLAPLRERGVLIVEAENRAQFRALNGRSPTMGSTGPVASMKPHAWRSWKSRATCPTPAPRRLRAECPHARPLHPTALHRRARGGRRPPARRR